MRRLLSNPPTRELTLSMWRWILFWNTTSFLALLIVTALALTDSPTEWPPRVFPSPLSWPVRAACLLGSVLWGGWYWLFVVRFHMWERCTHIKALSFFFAILLGFGLTWLHPLYIVLLFSLFGVTFGVLPVRYALPLVVFLLLAMIARAILPIGLTWTNLGDYVWLFFYGGSAILLGLWIHAITQQTRERERMINQLQFTRSELAKREREAGMLEERQRLASAIHDTLAQDLTSIVMHLEAAEQSLGSDAAAAQAHIDTARRAAREGLAEARRFVWALQPEVAEREPLPRALQRITQRWADETGIRAAFSLEGEERSLPPPVEVTLLRAAQEGLANVYKHAAAQSVNLTLTYMRDEVILDIQDDGVGFSLARMGGPDARDGSGYGLFSLRERARELGGSFQVESGPGQGTTLALQLPLAGRVVDRKEE